MSGLELKGFKGLGNLDTLLKEAYAPKDSLDNMQNLPIDFLTPGKYQPRKNIDDHSLSELVDSIKSQGIIQPIIVRRIEHNSYEIIAGERRWRAAKAAELSYIPAVIREIDDNTALAFSLIENIQRQNLNVIEEAVAFARFQEEFAMTHAEIAAKIGKSRESVTNILRLLSLEIPVRALLEEGKLAMGHARALLTLNSEPQIMLAQQIVENQLSVRETERLAYNIKNFLPKTVNKMLSFGDHERQYYWSEELARKFSSKVTVKLNEEGRGQIIIHVDSPDQIDKLIDS
ncbi:MAG: ParB/RepB/Spo0J family partition protein [Gammaproteobacteria bacterium]